MSTYIATVIKTGNSYALRVPKQYVQDAQLQVGEKAAIGLPNTMPLAQDNTKLTELFRQLQEVSKGGRGLAGIKDPVAWQRELRKDRPLPGRD